MTDKEKKISIGSSVFFRTAGTFVIAGALTTALYAFIEEYTDYSRILKLLPILLGWFLCAYCAKRTNSVLLIVGSMLCSCLLGYAMSYDKLSTVMHILLAAAGCVYALYERQRPYMKRQPSNSVMSVFIGLIPLLLVLIASWLMKTPGLATAMFTANLLYVPISLAALLNERIEKNLHRFEGKTAQPIAAVRSNVGGYVSLAICIVLLVAMCMPQDDGGTMINLILDAIAAAALAVWALAMALFALLGSCYPDSSIVVTPTDMPNIDDLMPTEPSAVGELIKILLAVIIISVLVIYLLIKLTGLVKWIAEQLRNGISNRGKAASIRELSKYDTVELLPDEPKPEKKPAGGIGSNAQRVRKLYKQRIDKLQRCGLKIAAADTPDALASRSKKLGYDIDELTECYKLARYTADCPPELLKRARAADRNIKRETDIDT